MSDGWKMDTSRMLICKCGNKLIRGMWVKCTVCGREYLILNGKMEKLDGGYRKDNSA